jgi:hypothetical protein
MQIPGLLTAGSRLHIADLILRERLRGDWSVGKINLEPILVGGCSHANGDTGGGYRASLGKKGGRFAIDARQSQNGSDSSLSVLRSDPREFLR